MNMTNMIFLQMSVEIDVNRCLYNSLSPELILSVYSHPRWVSSGQELRLWYGEDLVNSSEGDNGGRACCDVYALYV